MRTLILPYSSASESARNLANAMGLRRASLTRRSALGSSRNLINWGNSGSDVPPEVLIGCERMYNPIANVTTAINKLSCLEALSGASVTIPEFTSNQDIARQWAEEGTEVVCRTMLRASEGRGIELATAPHQVVNAPLYTKYVKKRDEYRVHVVGGVVVDVQRKARRSSSGNVNWKIRNLAGGFVFVRGGVNPPECVLTQSVNAINALGLDFGAVDVVYNAHRESAFVLEVNTACGLEGTTLDTYSRSLSQLINGNTITPWTPNDAPVEETAREQDTSTNLDRDAAIALGIASMNSGRSRSYTTIEEVLADAVTEGVTESVNWTTPPSSWTTPSRATTPTIRAMSSDEIISTFRDEGLDDEF